MATPQKSASQINHEQSMKSELYGIDISFTLLAVLCVFLRFWARWRSTGSYGWDDWLVLTSMFMVWINFALNAVMIEHGLGLQADTVPLPSLVAIGKAIYGDEIVYVVVLAVIKIAILVMYCRVFPLRRFRIAAWILGILTATWSLLFIFLCIFQCSPIPRAWNLTIPGTCLNLRAVFIGNAIPNIITDAAILVMPIYHVWRLQLRNAQRIALTGIFMLGAFVIVASIYRFTTILQLNPMNLSYTLKSPTTWSHVEVSVALICACLPTMKPLLTAFLGVFGLRGTSQHATPHKISGAGGGESAMQQSHKKKPSKGFSNFSVLDEGQDEWSPSTATSSNDQYTLKDIQVQRDYEQTVVNNRLPKDWMDEHTKRSWYPGN